MKSIYQRTSRVLPDSAFVPGGLKFLVPGNEGRLLDARRTPLHIERYVDRGALFHARVMAFEDRGAIWELPAEQVASMQFAAGSRTVDSAEVRRRIHAVKRWSRTTVALPRPGDRLATEARIRRILPGVRTWLKRHSKFLADPSPLPGRGRTGPPALQNDFATYMKKLGLQGLDEEVSRIWASQNGGELIKILQLTLARLGFLAYRGPIVRDHALEAQWGLDQTMPRYVLHRLAFLRALFSALKRPTITLYRGMSSDVGWRAVHNAWSSWTPLAQVARCHSDFDRFGQHRGRSSDSYLIKRTFPVEQVFMTYWETPGLNRVWKETEVIILHGEADRRFM